MSLSPMPGSSYRLHVRLSERDFAAAALQPETHLDMVTSDRIIGDRQCEVRRQPKRRDHVNTKLNTKFRPILRRGFSNITATAAIIANAL